jgi:hypothetical protein
MFKRDDDGKIRPGTDHNIAPNPGCGGYSEQAERMIKELLSETGDTLANGTAQGAAEAKP